MHVHKKPTNSLSLRLQFPIVTRRREGKTGPQIFSVHMFGVDVSLDLPEHEDNEEFIIVHSFIDFQNWSIF